MIAQAVANGVNTHFISLSGPEIMNKYYGESEGRLREVFEEAEQNVPSFIFIDKIDSGVPKREDIKREVERWIVPQSLSLMDSLKSRGKVIVIVVTNLPDNLDPALRRGGRFDREIEIGIQDISGRLKIFQIHSRNVPLDITNTHISDEDLTGDKREPLHRIDTNIDELNQEIDGLTTTDKSEKNERSSNLHEQKSELENTIRKRIFIQPYANQIHGFVGADITVAKDDFDAALTDVNPSAMREVLIEIPDVTWGLKKSGKNYRRLLTGQSDILKFFTNSIQRHPRAFYSLAREQGKPWRQRLLQT